MAAPRIPNAVLSALAHPLPSAILFAGVLAGMILSSFKVFKKFAQKQQEIFDNHTGVENKLSYFIAQIYGNVKTAKIIRIYGMEEMIFENTMRNQKQSNPWKGTEEDSCQLWRKSKWELFWGYRLSVKAR